MGLSSLLTLLILAEALGQQTVSAAQAPQFVNPSFSALSASSNYVGASNGSLPKMSIVSGKVFDRVTQVCIMIPDEISRF